MPFRERRANHTASLLLLLLTACLIAMSCGSLQVPFEAPPIKSEELVKQSQKGIDIQAKAIEGRYRYWDLFDDNLPEIGIVAVWVKVKNIRDGSIDLNRTKWILELDGAKHKAIDVSRVLDIYYEKRSVRFYSQNADRQTRHKLHNIIFKPGSIASHLERDGFLFFRVDSGTEKGWSRNATLRAEEIRLEDRQQTEIRLSLTHVNP